MRQRILDILTEIETERGSDDGTKVIVLEGVANLFHDLIAATPKLDGFQLQKAVRDARSLMLDILLRLRNERPDRTDRKTELEADRFWDGSMREHFVEDAEKLAAEPKTRELYKEVHEDGEQPINDFIDGVDEKIDQDLAMFVYNMLSEDPATV